MPMPFKRLLFRLHQITGLTAGAVLAVVGVSGGLIGFEQPLLAAFNPQLRIEAPAGVAPLPPDALIAAAAQAYPELRARRMAWNGNDTPVTVRMAHGTRRGGTQVMVDPYTAQVLDSPRGTGFFRAVEDLHRHLAAGAIGKQIVGASTALLLLLAISGLVLRWPRRARAWRAWLKLDLRLRGRSLLWHLHAVIGTWLLAFYVLAALTGLWWSYDVYRNAVNQMAGVSGSLRPRAPPPGDADAPPIAIDAAWTQFRRVVPEATRATVTLGSDPRAPVQLRYQTPDSAHERAWNTLALDARDGHVVTRQRYAELPRGRRFVGALFPLHSGSFFGTPGLWLMSLASLLMPLFFVTGSWMWLKKRRRGTQSQRSSRVQMAPSASRTGKLAIGTTAGGAVTAPVRRSKRAP
jgi:sulfite reductase (NADPH) flavoprotein alpha-component